MDAPWFTFVLSIFASWRLAHLLAHEDGPWDGLARLRAVLGDSILGRMMDCFYCVSLWVAAPFALLVGRTAQECVLAWLALSGAACLLERIRPDSREPEDVQTEGERHELLRQQANGITEQYSDQFKL